MRQLSLFAIALTLSVAACSREAAPPPKPLAVAKTEAPAAAAAPAAAPATATATATGPGSAEADQVFSTRCTACHGATGAGDGAAAGSLNPKPRSFTDAAWQKTVDDAYLSKVILEGGVAVGKSAMMTANPDLKDKPEVLKALVAKVRSLAK